MRRPVLTLSFLALFVAGAAPRWWERGDPAPRPRVERFFTDRASDVELPLPGETDAFSFAVFGDRTGGPAEGVRILAQAVDEVNLLGPDLVMTVGDLIEGYNQTPEWLRQHAEFKGIMDGLSAPWFPVAGNHDVYWRGPDGARPEGEHEANYEANFGPLWYALRHKGSWFVVLYSDEGDPTTGRKAFNEPGAQRMSERQFAFLDDTLTRAAEADHVFVFLHHPRWTGGHYGDDWERVHARLVEAGNVTAVFAGHIHRMRYDPRDGIEYFTLATVGGGQWGRVPEAGYLHQYHVVTVRPESIAVTTLPVGAALDPRAITPEVSADARRMFDALVPRFEGALPLQVDGSSAGTVALSLANPTGRPVELSVALEAGDKRWRLDPDHTHFELEPGGTQVVQVRAARDPSPLDAGFVLPRVLVSADYLGEHVRVPIPARERELPLDLSALLAREEPGPGVLVLDGVDDALLVPSDRLAVPDGPLTVEGWLRADAFRERQGFVTKTESSEFGLFVDGGRPMFLVLLDGQYRQARAAEPVLQTDRWHHVAGVFDGAELRVYVDGELVGRGPGRGERRTNALPLVIGGDVSSNGSANSVFPGRIDSVRLSSVARYAEASFQPEREPRADEATLALFHMEHSVLGHLADSSGRGAHARAVGGARVEPE